jgi:pimeloyl-ACP methyl ester carboxylesterase
VRCPIPSFDSSGVNINYIDEGSGPPVMLVHGFASSLHGNWRAPGIVNAILATGRRVLALDCRGHGRSGKPHDPGAYGGMAMPNDVIALMDHRSVQQADLIGYSMGGFIAASLITRHPERFRSCILSGVGEGLVTLASGGMRAWSGSIARAMRAADGGQSEDERARGFRTFAEATGNDLEALAAMQESPRRWIEPEALGKFDMPVMVLVGEGDTLVGSGAGLAQRIPGATHVRVPGDHLTAVGQPHLKAAIIDFLAKHTPVS